MKHEFVWHRLDNSGRLYPFKLKHNAQNLFRISAILKEEVKPDILTVALQNAIKRYPFFNVCLRRGIFWHYLEQLDGKPQVYPDSDILIKNIDTILTYGYNFRVSYFNNKVSLDCFHALCDGNGGMEFFKTILYEYFRLQGISIDTQGFIRLPTEPPLAEEVEDGFLKYSKKVKVKDLKGVQEMRGKRAFTFDDKCFDYRGGGVIEGVFDTKQLLEKSHENNATITAFVGGALIYSIYKTKIKENENRPIVLFIPINLRKPFNSKTLLNFSLFSRVAVDCTNNPSFDDIVKQVGDTLIKDVQVEGLQDKINTTAKLERFWLMRILPLPVKHLILKISSLFFGANKKTMTFSNMGVVKIPDDMKPLIDEISIMASTAKTSPMAMTSVSAVGKTTMTFNRRLISREVEKYFFRFLSDQGLDITIRSNYWEK